MTVSTMGYQAIRTDNKIAAKSRTIDSSTATRSPPRRIHLAGIMQHNSATSPATGVSPLLRRESLVSPGAVLPPLDPQLYYQSQQPQIIPQPPQQQQNQQQHHHQQHHHQQAAQQQAHQLSSRRNTEPRGEPVSSSEKYSPLNPLQQHQLPNHRVTLPPLSTIAPGSISSASSSEPRSRDNSFAGPSAHRSAATQAPAYTQQQPQQPPVQAPPSLLPQQQQPQPQQHIPQQIQIEQIPQHQYQPQQQVYSPPYPMYTAQPIPPQGAPEYQYPSYIYPPPQHMQGKEHGIPVPVMYQSYRPQYGQPMYAAPQPPAMALQPGLVGPPPPHGAQLHQQVIYHPHPGFSFGNIDNSKKMPRRRTRTGCLTCRKRRIKCDERKPHCLNCEKSRKVCLGYEQPPFQNRNRKFKDGLSLDQDENDDGEQLSSGGEGNYHEANTSSNNNSKERITVAN